MPIIGLSDLKQKSDANQGTHATVENSSDTLLVQKEIPDSEADAKTEPQAKTSGNSDNPPTTSSGGKQAGGGEKEQPAVKAFRLGSKSSALPVRKSPSESAATGRKRRGGTDSGAPGVKKSRSL